MKRRYILFFCLISLVTIISRFIFLDRVPPHLSNDEISIAYDAYSISGSLRDEHNQFLPISFRSHGTYKAPLTIYLTSISVLIFGNNDYSARIPSALLGSLSVLYLGLLCFELTKNKSLAFLASTVLTISPWHIYTSRMALETNIALFFLIGGIYYFFMATHRRKYLLYFLAFFFFGLSMYAYHTEWGLTPIIIMLLLFLYWKRTYYEAPTSLRSRYLLPPLHQVLYSTWLRRVRNPSEAEISSHSAPRVRLGWFSAKGDKKILAAAFIYFIIFISPLFINYIQNRGTTARANTQMLLTNDALKKQLEKYPDNLFRKGQLVISAISGTYSSYISPGYIFFNSPNLLPQKNPLQAGLILAPFFPMFIFGLFKIKKYFGQNTIFIILLLISSPVIPALTIGGQQAVRNLPFIVPCVIVISVGVYEFLTKFQNNKTLILLFIGLIFVTFFYFCSLYFYYFPKEAGENYQYGYKQIADIIYPLYDKYDKFIIDPKFGEGYTYDGVPHLYIAYFTNLDPSFLQNRPINDPCGNCFAKYEVRGINWDKENIQNNFIYVVPYSNKIPIALESQLSKLAEIALPDQKPAFIIYGKK